MPSLKIAVPHTHGLQGALDRLQGFMVRMKEEHKDQVSDLQESWQGNRLDYSFKTFGLKVRGAVEVHEDNVAVHTDLPLAAIMFKGRIEQEIRETLEKALA